MPPHRGCSSLRAANRIWASLYCLLWQRPQCLSCSSPQLPHGHRSRGCHRRRCIRSILALVGCLWQLTLRWLQKAQAATPCHLPWPLCFLSRVLAESLQGTSPAVAHTECRVVLSYMCCPHAAAACLQSLLVSVCSHCWKYCWCCCTEPHPPLSVCPALRRTLSCRTILASRASAGSSNSKLTNCLVRPRYKWLWIGRSHNSCLWWQDRLSAYSASCHYPAEKASAGQTVCSLLTEASWLSL